VHVPGIANTVLLARVVKGLDSVLLRSFPSVGPAIIRQSRMPEPQQIVHDLFHGPIIVESPRSESRSTD